MGKLAHLLGSHSRWAVRWALGTPGSRGPLLLGAGPPWRWCVGSSALRCGGHLKTDLREDPVWATHSGHVASVSVWTREGQLPASQLGRDCRHLRHKTKWGKPGTQLLSPEQQPGGGTVQLLESDSRGDWRPLRGSQTNPGWPCCLPVGSGSRGASQVVALAGGYLVASPGLFQAFSFFLVRLGWIL